jgi:hypothetical protein
MHPDPIEQIAALVEKWRKMFPVSALKCSDDYYAGQACGTLKCSDQLETLAAALRQQREAGQSDRSQPIEQAPGDRPEPMRRDVARLLDNLYGLHFRPGHLDALLEVIQLHAPVKVPIGGLQGLITAKYLNPGCAEKGCQFLQREAGQPPALSELVTCSLRSPDYVCHLPRLDCQHETPHLIAACGAFGDPLRAEAQTPTQADQPICMFCDGCGWCEGSPAFTCPRCKGSGVDGAAEAQPEQEKP